MNAKQNIMNVAVVGCGAISDIYLENMIHRFDNLNVIACCANHPEHAKEKAEKAGFHNVTFAIGDAEDTKEPAEQYDIVINRHLVWTLPHPEKAIKEWKRVLKPGGRLVIMEGNWHYNRLSDRIQVFFGKCLITLVEHRNAFSNDGDYDKDTKEELPMMKSRNAKRLSRMVQDAGMKVTVLPMTEVDRAEKKAMPLRYRLLNPHKRITVIGVKE